MNQGQSALPYLKESVASNPQKPVYHYHLGMAYLKAGKKSEAKIELRTALLSGAPFAGSVDAKESLESISTSQ
jgi:predicted Zn-dependent protease